MFLDVEVGKAPNAPERESEMQDTPPCQCPKAAPSALQRAAFFILTAQKHALRANARGACETVEKGKAFSDKRIAACRSARIVR